MSLLTLHSDILHYVAEFLFVPERARLRSVCRTLYNNRGVISSIRELNRYAMNEEQYTLAAQIYPLERYECSYNKLCILADHLTSLKFLELLTGELPECVSKLTKLERLWVLEHDAVISLNPYLPPSLQVLKGRFLLQPVEYLMRLTNLQRVDLQDISDECSSMPSSITALKFIGNECRPSQYIESLEMMVDRLDGNPSWLSPESLPVLQSLRLACYRQMCEIDLSAFSPTLTSLSCEYNVWRANSTLMTNLCALRVFDASDSLLPTLQFPRLQSLGFTFKSYGGLSPAFVSSLARYTTLTDLDLRYISYTHGLTSLTNLTRLSVMFPNEVPSEINLFRKLKTLYIDLMRKKDYVRINHVPLILPSLQTLSLALCNVEEFPQIVATRLPMLQRLQTTWYDEDGYIVPIDFSDIRRVAPYIPRWMEWIDEGDSI